MAVHIKPYFAKYFVKVNCSTSSTSSIIQITFHSYPLEHYLLRFPVPEQLDSIMSIEQQILDTSAGK